MPVAAGRLRPEHQAMLLEIEPTLPLLLKEVPSTVKVTLDDVFLQVIVCHRLSDRSGPAVMLRAPPVPANLQKALPVMRISIL